MEVCTVVFRAFPLGNITVTKPRLYVQFYFHLPIWSAIRVGQHIEVAVIRRQPQKQCFVVVDAWVNQFPGLLEEDGERDISTLLANKMYNFISRFSVFLKSSS